MIDVVGDACVDLVLPVPRVPEPDEKVHTTTAAMSPGGVALNVAVALARLGSETALHARIGQDAFGSMVLQTLETEAVDTTGVAVDASIDTYFTMSLITDDSPEKRMVVAVTPGLYPETATWDPPPGVTPLPSIWMLRPASPTGGAPWTSRSRSTWNRPVFPTTRPTSPQ